MFATLNRAAAASRYDATDQQVSLAMQKYWTNFARTGDPNGPNLTRRPRFDPASRAYLDFTSAGPVAKEGLRREFCELYTERLRRQLAR